MSAPCDTLARRRRRAKHTHIALALALPGASIRTVAALLGASTRTVQQVKRAYHGPGPIAPARKPSRTAPPFSAPLALAG